MSLKKFLEDYLTFGRNERIGIIVLMLMILFIVFLPRWYAKTQVKSMIAVDTAMLNAMDSDQINKRFTSGDDKEEEQKIAYAPSKTAFNGNAALFEFDPNTLDARGWQKLGLNDRLIKTILNYRTKGGKFYKKEDLKKIWGMPEAFYNRVEAYINIASVQSKFSNTYAKPEKKIIPVEINIADTAAFIALPAIGNKLAARIISYREKLGGFYSIDQVAETWGLSDSAFQVIKPYLLVKEAQTKRLNINQASKDDLKVHPYIRWKLASAIVDYRIRHGLYNNLNELKNIPDIDEATFEKIRYYLKL
ncbi:MAG: DNA-binding protein [Chitinophagaceae bacterium]